MRNLFLIVFISLLVNATYGQGGDMIVIEGGSYMPLYGDSENEVQVTAFRLDQYPVTNADYLDFVRDQKEWQKDNPIKLYVDEAYLNHWASPLDLGDALPEAAVTNVSWFAAKAYCAWKGKRLPTLDEWEYAAMAGENATDARTLEEYNQYILSWYETAHTHLNPVGTGMKNVYGIYDLHGLVWEWTYDFSSVLLSSESRQGGNSDNNLFCGASAIGATDLMDYAAFMRYAFRSSMKARYTSRNLGFRCAEDVKDNQQ
ncbi:formylglycine-generating enzyme family protein [Membranicola marinus]|uniref:Formylglycine-generating enzyme family protein n=1 Tax=Membranihabitans marinus TaxID=1227546 RepID=A0A953L9P8_9BACT|nr:formylglycine-generating enzyme family protein [Membranihabitans marinus]MBY5957853.1 formylglycine-generating enzyme family protein [Membranihabitans marinus]